MARSFVRSSSQYLKRDIAAGTGYPLTMACWFYSTNADVWQTLMCLADSASDTHYINLELRGDGVDQVRIIVRDNLGYKYADTTTGYSAGIWQHACAICASSTDRRVFIDGGSKGTNTESKGFPSGIDRTGIAALARPTLTACLDGYVAEAAVWNAALTDAEVGILAKGYSPLFVRPQNLTHYWPLLQVDVTSNPEIIGKLYLADYNSPGMAVHPRVIYPAPPISFMAAGGITPLLLRAIEKY